MMGKRVGYGKEAMAPHNLPLTMVGASLLWVGWFGFNAGSALEAGNSAALAFMNTFSATACAVLAWCAGESLMKGKASMPVSYTHLDVYKRQVDGVCPAVGAGSQKGVAAHRNPFTSGPLAYLL